jgi:nicotinamide riboside kinase
MQMKKIAFTGAPCTGKTTLFEALHAIYGDNEQVAFASEAARKFFAANQDIPSHKRQGYTAQSQILDLVMKQEAKLVSGQAKLAICDRSVTDPVVYTVVGGDRPAAEKLYKIIQDWIPTYTKLYILDPTDITHQADDIRLEDEAGRQQLHQGFLDFFADKQIEFELLSGTLEERLAKVQAVIQPLIAS